MSEAAMRELEEVRKRILERQRTCAWCGKVCENADHLYIHIVLRHKEVQ